AVPGPTPPSQRPDRDRTGPSRGPEPTRWPDPCERDGRAVRVGCTGADRSAAALRWGRAAPADRAARGPWPGPVRLGSAWLRRPDTRPDDPARSHPPVAPGRDARGHTDLVGRPPAGAGLAHHRAAVRPHAAGARPARAVAARTASPGRPDRAGLGERR